MTTSENVSDASCDSRAAAVPSGRFPECNSAMRSWWPWFETLLFLLAPTTLTHLRRSVPFNIYDEQTYETVYALVHPKTPASVS